MNTKSLKPSEVNKKWFLIDLEGVVAGRAAAHVAGILRGKNKPQFTPHVDCGDNVIVVNADKLKLTGNKIADKIYYKHTGYPGGVKDTSPEKLISGGKGEKVFEFAVKRMLPRTKLGRKQFSNLFVYSDATHPHEAQKPEVIDFKSLNRKNS